MKLKLKKKILKLYPDYYSVYGPYIRSDGRKIVILYDGWKRTARQYAKVKLEVKLGRRLLKGEEVDHIDNDFTNNKYSNLQVLSTKQNRVKERRFICGPEKLVKCKYCGKLTKRNKFCSNSCRSRYYGANQYGNKITGYK
jgi:hypothetical protein